MQRTRIDLSTVAALPNLAAATRLAARGKRRRPAVQAFLADLEHSLSELAEAILSGRAPIGRFRRFRIRDPKPRLIHAACFPDRVLHHAMMRPAGPVLERAMTETSYACRVGKGSLAAVHAAQRGIRRWPWYVQIDISGYFEHIDHAILRGLLARRFKGRPFLALIDRVLENGAIQPGHGLPIGSLTSQYFANYFLDGLDRLLLAQPAVRAELRYMDDVLWFCDSREQARATLALAQDWLGGERNWNTGLRLALAPRIGGYRPEDQTRIPSRPAGKQPMAAGVLVGRAGARRRLAGGPTFPSLASGR